ncbi:hypothetical protein RchiOBHm_Chr5g0023041 [Rosa chinensis]|uniref:Uncharacterized protein n=1 Tax=Rosa chinensis TaxID=74649 RepID=A0A2P6Q800_ROSCH|nr:hypothetical protein RchiOBHm_Chr5g0023041 [Rosa chinensis]
MEKYLPIVGTTTSMMIANIPTAPSSQPLLGPSCWIPNTVDRMTHTKRRKTVQSKQDCRRSLKKLGVGACVVETTALCRS